MSAIEPTLMQKLQKLPAQRLAEVEDFVEFLSRVSRMGKWGESNGK